MKRVLPQASLVLASLLNHLCGPGNVFTAQSLSLVPHKLEVSNMPASRIASEITQDMVAEMAL